MGKEEKKPESSYTKGQRMAALIGVIFLLALYLITLVAAITAYEGASELFMMCIGSSILLPIMFWLYIRFAKLFTGQHRQDGTGGGGTGSN